MIVLCFVIQGDMFAVSHFDLWRFWFMLHFILFGQVGLHTIDSHFLIKTVASVQKLTFSVKGIGFIKKKKHEFIDLFF